MPESMLESFGLIALATVFAFSLRGLSARLRKRFETRARPPAPPAPRETGGRYFLVAVVGFVLHAGSFYFYLWGAAAGAVGLEGLMVMLAVGFCLMVAIFYSWAQRRSWVEEPSPRGEDGPTSD